MVEHRDEAARALRGGQAARHLHRLHQQLSQLLAQMQQHRQGPGLLQRGLQGAQRFPVLPRKAGRLHLWGGGGQEARDSPHVLDGGTEAQWTDVFGEGVPEECDGGGV